MVHRIGAETLPMPGAIEGNMARPSGAGTRAWRFDGFEFDLRRGELHGRDGAPIALRPKAEALLRVLLTQPGRLFSREELIAAVWPGAVVTDDSLVQCVGELRTALDDQAQTLIRTVPRRGYRLDPPVVPIVDVPAVRLALPVSADPAANEVPPGPIAAGHRAWRPGLRSSAVMVVIAALAAAAALYFRPAATPMRIDEVVAARHTIAVMPFGASAEDPVLRNFAHAVADEIAAQFAPRAGMRVIGRATTSGYASPSPDLDRLASTLKATYVVTGSVARAGGTSLSIDVQILGVASREVVWAQRFEHADASEPVDKTDLGLQVVSALRTRFSEIDSALALRPGHTPDAADLTLLGWYDLDRRLSKADLRRARARFEEALRQDPESVIALNGLGATYLTERNERNPATAAEIAESERVIGLARKIDPNDATALLSWSNLQLLNGRADLALPALEKSIRIVPSYPAGYLFHAQALLLLGRTDEVQAQADRAVRLATRDPPKLSSAYLIAAEAALMRGEDDRASDLARRAIAARPANAPAHATLAAIDALAGRDEHARTEIATFLKLWPAATVARYDELRRSTHPVYLAQRARLYEGLRKAGLPDR